MFREETLTLTHSTAKGGEDFAPPHIPLNLCRLQFDIYFARLQLPFEITMLIRCAEPGRFSRAVTAAFFICIRSGGGDGCRLKIKRPRLCKVLRAPPR